jgi:hypothetical protein
MRGRPFGLRNADHQGPLMTCGLSMRLQVISEKNTGLDSLDAKRDVEARQKPSIGSR